jgi:hypothetical protein
MALQRLEGLRNICYGGPEPRLSAAQKAELAAIVDTDLTRQPTALFAGGAAQDGEMVEAYEKTSRAGSAHIWPICQRARPSKYGSRTRRASARKNGVVRQ